MIPNGAYQENAYLMWDDRVKMGISMCLSLSIIGALIDPGEEPKKIIEALEKCEVNISLK